MQIVIDISEEDMQYISTYGQCDAMKLMCAIANGTPLPKGHGDLIDRKELLENKYEIDTMCCEYDVVDVDDIKDAPTIIEADKESEEQA